MFTNDSKVISSEELEAELISQFGDDVKEDFEKIAKDCSEPYEWSLIEGTDLLIGITPLAGGVLQCCRCESSWSINYYWISLPKYLESEDSNGFNQIVNYWKESKKWWECPFCSYEELED